MKKIIPYVIIVCLIVISAPCFAQQAGQRSYVRLDETLKGIESKFDVDLQYQDELIADRWVKDTGWKEKDSVEQSLIRVLSAHHLMFEKEENSRSYRITAFNVERRSVEEGKSQLEYLSYRYNNGAAWKKRSKVLRQCIYEALQLSPLPPRPDSEPVISSSRIMDGYTIENIAIETLPGLFVSGSLYRPSEIQGKVPVILNPHGHFEKSRYRADQQYRMATLARMGAIAFSYDMFAWGESLLQFNSEDHYRRQGLAMSIQILNGIRILDFLIGLEEADPARVGITGASGGGSQTMLLTALDERIDVSVPVVMLSSYFNGGCACENGRPVHFCGGGTSNAEIAALAAPRPQLIVSDGNDWTAHVPEITYPYLQTIYGYYGQTEKVSNVHLPDERHDYGISKRVAMYEFMAKYLGLDLDAVKDKNGNIDESRTTIVEESALYVFGKNGEQLPDYAIQNFETLRQVFKEATGN